MEWYFWVFAIGPVILGGVLGCLLDTRYNFNSRRSYWLLGVFSMLPAVFVTGIVL